MNLTQQYLYALNAQERIGILKQCAKQNWSIPLDISRDLLALPLQTAEHIALLKATDSSDKVSFEDLITHGIFFWNQNVASAALWEWSARTDCLLWHRTYLLAMDPRIPQRLSYTLVDLAWYGAGERIIDLFLNLRDLEHMSPAFIAILFQRAMQWNMHSERLINIAKEHLSHADQPTSSTDRTLPYAATYLLQNSPDDVNLEAWTSPFNHIWPEIVRTLSRPFEVTGPWLKTLSKKNIKNALQSWPSLWERHTLTTDQTAKAVEWLVQQQSQLPPQVRPWELVAGIPASRLREGILQQPNAAQQASAFTLIGNLLHIDDREMLLTHFRNEMARVQNPMEILGNLSQRDRIELNRDEKKESLFGRIEKERRTILDHCTYPRAEFPEFSVNLTDQERPDAQPETIARHRFINMAYYEDKPSAFSGSTAWDRLGQCWITPKEQLIDQLAIDARQSPAIFHSCFIDTLGRFTHVDKAALKLLDFVRSPDEDIIRSVVRALAGIGTLRAYQEMIAFLTRPNINVNIQIEIAQLLKNTDLSQLQSELRSAIKDLRVGAESHDEAMALRESLTLLLQVPEPAARIQTASLPVNPVQSGSEELETQLIQKIPEYTFLSSEVKRALRTAQFFQTQITQASDLHTMDLSPAIDMQYKALELTFREYFEDPCSQALRTSVIQRKLDVIGYARPNPHGMEEFENYIESLPIINTIPFFSRFKLHKMLRAICQFRAGKRFTLDGLKAFGLFFLCFSRKRCRYGLENLFPLTNITDEQLADFCKQLHVFQDFRNRAAHEGFHPSASNNLDGIWQDTAMIIKMAYAIRREWEAANPSAPEMTQAPSSLIAKKVS